MRILDVKKSTQNTFVSRVNHPGREEGTRAPQRRSHKQLAHAVQGDVDRLVELDKVRSLGQHDRASPVLAAKGELGCAGRLATRVVKVDGWS